MPRTRPPEERPVEQVIGVLYALDVGDPVSEFVSRLPHPRLRPFITEYTGYRIGGVEPGTHAGLPSRSLTLIVAFDDPLDVEHPSGGAAGRDTYWAMLGGLHSTPATVRHPGRQHGVQLRLTPQGVPALFGVRAAAFASDVVHLEDVVGPAARELVDRLSSTPTWPARWAVLDDVFLRMVTKETRRPDQLDHAWSLLIGSNGSIGIQDLAREVGWSRRHLAGTFKRRFGLSPKTLARVVRFEQAQRLLRLPTRPSLASVAAVCGYADQAHMTREWKRIAGTSPTSWLTDEPIPILQDDEGVRPSE